MPPPAPSLKFPATHPNNDAVVPLENGDELVSPQYLGLVQGPKPAEHLDAAFVVGLRHGGRRRGLGLSLGGGGGACSEGGSSAEAEAGDRCWVSGAEKGLGAPGRRLGSRAGAHWLSPVAAGCGMRDAGDLSVWSSPGSASPPLALQRRSAGLGGAAGRGAGPPRRGDAGAAQVHHPAPFLPWSLFFSHP